MRGFWLIVSAAAVAALAFEHAASAQTHPGRPPGTQASDRPAASARQRTAAARPAATRPAAPRSTLATLQQRVPAIEFQDTPLEDALGQLAEFGRVNLVVQWEQLELAGVTRTQPVSLRLRGLPFRDVLQLLLREAAGGDARLAFRTVGNLVVVSTVERFSEELLVRTYDINDLLVEEVSAPDIFIGRVHDYVRSVRPRVAAGAVGLEPEVETAFSGTQVRYPSGRGGYSGGGLGIGPGGLNEFGRRDDEQADSRTREQHIAELIEAITQTIEPDSWDVNGGRGTIREFRGLLIVRASPFVHQALGGPLRETRR